MSKIYCEPRSNVFPLGASAFSLLLLSGVAGRAYAADPPAADLLTKMNALYAANTYQGVALLTQKGLSEENKPYLTKGTQEVSYKSPNLFLVKSVGDAGSGTQVRAFDGNQIVNYNSALKQYMKRPLKNGANPITPLPLLSLFGVTVDSQSGKVTGSASVGGKAAYLVQTTVPLPPIRPNASEQDKAMREEFRKTLPTFELAIDKKDYRLLRVIQTSKEAKMTRTLEFTQQAFNPTLAENAFVFNPPPGSQSQQAAMKAMLKNGSNGGNSASALAQGQTSRASKGNPLPPPHASPGAGSTTPRP